MRTLVLFEVVWQVLAPIVSHEALNAKLVLATLNSIRFQKGSRRRVVRNGTVSVSIDVEKPRRATLHVFVGPAAFARAEVENTSKGWCVSKLGVRSSVHRLLVPACLRNNINVVADGTLHALKVV